MFFSFSRQRCRLDTQHLCGRSSCSLRSLQRFLNLLLLKLRYLFVERTTTRVQICRFNNALIGKSSLCTRNAPGGAAMTMRRTSLSSSRTLPRQEVATHGFYGWGIKAHNITFVFFIKLFTKQVD